MVQLYGENYSRTDFEYHYEKWTILDQINIVQGRVPFKNFTAVTRLTALMLEEAKVRKIMLDANDCKKHSIIIKKLKEHTKDKDSFKPRLLLNQFNWY